jgi:hypothetical protein
MGASNDNYDIKMLTGMGFDKPLHGAASFMA